MTFDTSAFCFFIIKNILESIKITIQALSLRFYELKKNAFRDS